MQMLYHLKYLLQYFLVLGCYMVVVVLLCCWYVLARVLASDASVLLSSCCGIQGGLFGCCWLAAMVSRVVTRMLLLGSGILCGCWVVLVDCCGISGVCQGWFGILGLRQGIAKVVLEIEPCSKILKNVYFCIILQQLNIGYFFCLIKWPSIFFVSLFNWVLIFSSCENLSVLGHIYAENICNSKGFTNYQAPLQLFQECCQVVSVVFQVIARLLLCYPMYCQRVAMWFIQYPKWLQGCSQMVFMVFYLDARGLLGGIRLFSAGFKCIVM